MDLLGPTSTMKQFVLTATYQITLKPTVVGSNATSVNRILLDPTNVTAANTRRNARSTVSMLTLGPHYTLNAFESPASSSAWILDSGASDHFCNDAAWFEELQPFEGTVRAANGSDMPIAGTGSVLLEMNTPTGIIPVTLQDVLFIPNLQYNLFSLSRVTDRGLTLSSSVMLATLLVKKLCMLKASNMTTYSTSTLQTLCQHSRLPLLTLICPCTNSATPTQADLWHARLGHISVKYTAKTCQYTDGIELDDCKHAFCESCLAGKQSRLPFPKRSLSTTLEPFALVHLDICGPMRHPALRDRSRTSRILSNASRSSLPTAALINLPVRCLRSDNGGEYFSTLFSEFLLENGIQHDATVPHTPQQNGVSERMNRTLVESARSLLHFCKAPLRFWAEAVSHAMYLWNRTYSASTPGTTPFEKLWKSKPDLGNLRIFGCEAYAHVESHQRTKFASKTIRAMYLGHEPNVKGYRLYTSSPERIIVSRNVVFNETKSFFTEEPSADESPVSQLIDEIDDDDELSLRDETLALPAAPPASTIVTSAPHEGTPIVPRRSTRIRRGNSRYNAPPVQVSQSTLVEPLPPPTRPIESTPPTPSITEADTSESRVENTPPQPLDDSTSSRVEPAPQQSPAESPADILLPSSPSHGPMSRTDTPGVTPEFVPVMMPPPASTDSTSFDEDALCEQFESLALSLFRLRPVANSDPCN
ncbi:hypothetical protein Ae201684P_009555 [Aphanomyces euteiches]|nr:hypothetical protein Ae201684P_009555 [Aphanomyces euteiches]